MRGWQGALLGLYVLLLLAGVLAPEHEQMLESNEPRHMLTPGWLADAARNVALFVPLGLGLGLRVRRWGWIAGIALACSGVIEGLQLFIPGRMSSVIDLASNTAGALAGAALPGWLAGLGRFDRRRPGRVSLCASGCGAAVLCVSSLLLAPSFPDATYYGGWTPDLPGLDVYGGHIVSAHVGGVAIVESGPAPDTEALRHALLERGTLAVESIAGPAPRRMSPLVTIADQVPRELLFVGAEGADLVYQHRTWAVAIGLTAPRGELPGALVDVEPGEPFSFEITRNGRSTRIRTSRGADQALDPGPGRMWSLWVPDWLVPRAIRPVIDAGWVALLIAPAAFLARRSIMAWAGVLAFCATAWGLHLVGPLAKPSTATSLAVAAVLVAAAIRTSTGSPRAGPGAGSRDTSGATQGTHTG